MTDASRPSTRPNPVTTPSAGVSRPVMSGAMPACVAWTPISVKVSRSKSRSRRSRTVSLPASCCLATASSPPIRAMRSRRAARSSALSFMAMLGRGLRPEVVGDAGVGRRAGDHRDHGGDLAAVVSGVIRHVLQPRPERDPEHLAFRVLELDRAPEVAGGEPSDEGLLFLLESVPALPHGGQGRELVAGDRRWRLALPAREPDRVGAIEVGEHAYERRVAEVLAQISGYGLGAQTGRVVEQLPVRPPVIVVESPYHLDRTHVAHDSLLTRAPPPCRPPAPSALPARGSPSPRRRGAPPPGSPSSSTPARSPGRRPARDHRPSSSPGRRRR